MASSSMKGTRKTYSFEEREILITLIKKYEDVDDKKTDPISMCKRKSAWTQLAEEYNLLVGPEGARSAVQLRRCWENMKACRKNREERKSWGNAKSFCQLMKDQGRTPLRCWDTVNSSRNDLSTAPPPGTAVGLPPNVVFEPKESEPFTLQSVCTPKPPKMNARKDLESSTSILSELTNRLKGENSSSFLIETSNSPDTFERNSVHVTGSDDGTTVPTNGPMGDCAERTNDPDSPILERSEDESLEKNEPIYRSNATQTVVSPMNQDRLVRRARKSVQREEELHVLALSEAQMKVDIAAMLKEEARIKLEEAHYRKEEARLRMLLFTYKLDRIKED